MEKIKIYLRQRHYYAKEIIGFLFILMGIYFLRQQRDELIRVKDSIFHSNPFWLLIGVGLVVIYITVQSLMYVFSFRTVGEKVFLKQAIILFLKRNLASVFLPGGGITSLALFNKEIEKSGVSKGKIHLASYIYGVIGIVTVVILVIPVIIFTGLSGKSVGSEWEEVGGLVVLLLLLTYISVSIYKRGAVFRLINRFFPAFSATVTEITQGTFSKKDLLITLLLSCCIECIGISHLYVATRALGFEGSLLSATVGYAIPTLFLCLSPFMRGLGAVEISMVYVLSGYGYNQTEGLSITFLYRLFEFWLPLVAGLLMFLFKKGNLFFRVFPPVLLFMLGIVNVLSILTPAISSRVHVLLQFIPAETIYFSNHMILFLGFLLMVCSALLFKGFKNAWYMAMVLSVLSFIGHLTKAIDYEEASFALFSVITLAITYKQYYIKGKNTINDTSIATALLVLMAVLAYGTMGFYFLQVHHFNNDFSLRESITNTLSCLVLMDPVHLAPRTEFARLFVYSINFLGIAAIAYLCYTLFQPFKPAAYSDKEERVLAKKLLDAHGISAVDYFKIAKDKRFFFSRAGDAFIAYKVANSFAVVLDEPVGANDETSNRILEEFDEFCADNSLNSCFYRVDQDRVVFFEKAGKKALPIGQEAIVNLSQFSLEGKGHKSLRNAMNSIQKKGFHTAIYPSPLNDGLVMKLRLVSDNWLKFNNREEFTFSQGWFDDDELKQCTIISLENEDGQIVAFLNIIPDNVKNEITYDLIRRTEDAPGGNMDSLIVALILYGRENGYTHLNMGLVPFSGIDAPENISQRTIRFAYEKLPAFKHYKGLREFKEKYEPEWHNKYLVYSNYYDLLQIPQALNKVMRSKDSL
ncbi:phosphatidylglycerol lysyltransferase [bacterium A37T11]|nr:phosphatidylglycerol lysyltransferase [bacterium A37T11]